MNKRTKAFFLKWSGSRTHRKMSDLDLQKAWITIAQHRLSSITNLIAPCSKYFKQQTYSQSFDICFLLGTGINL